MTADEVKSAIEVGDGKKITIKNSMVLEDGATLGADNNYTVELANTLNPKKTAASWGKLSSGKATYTYASTTEGYTLANNKVSYTAAVESTATLKNGKYTTAGVKTTGYKLADNKISYLTKNLKTITFSGLASGVKASDITVDDKKITLGKNAIPLDGTAVSIETSGYTLATDGLSEVIISDNGTAKKADYYFATDGTLPTGYIKTTGSDKKTYYVQKDAKFTKAYAEYGIKEAVAPK